MKCFSMRMIFDLLHKLLNSEMFCFFHNCMWVSWNSEINSVLLLLIHQYGSPRTYLIIFNMFRCQHATFCGFVSAYGFPRTCWVCDFIMFLLTRSVVVKLGAFLDFLLWTHVHIRSLTVLDNWVLGFGWIRWVSLLLPAISESKSHIQLSLSEIFGGGRGDTYDFLAYDFSQISSQLLSRYT